MNLKEIKKKMKSWSDCAGFDLSADIDSIKTSEDIKKIFQTHRDWLEDLATDAQHSTDKFEREILQECEE